MTTGGFHLTTGVNPDIAAFAKCMSNGYPMAAVVGRELFLRGQRYLYCIAEQ